MAGRLGAIISTRWFSACVAFALFSFLLYTYEENRFTGLLPLEPNLESGTIFSWTNHADHRVHYLTGYQHRRMAHLAAAMIVYWFSVCLAAWVRMGKPAPSTWSNFVYVSKPAKGAEWIIGIGATVSALLKHSIRLPKHLEVRPQAVSYRYEA